MSRSDLSHPPIICLSQLKLTGLSFVQGSDITSVKLIYAFHTATRYVSPFAMTTQAILAILLATATQALLCPLRANTA